MRAINTRPFFASNPRRYLRPDQGQVRGYVGIDRDQVHTTWLARPVIFFQAEDCIRYYKVTGVQTCALPIFALLFSALGIWLGLKLTRTRDTVIVREVPVAGPFTRNETRLEQLGITPRELEILEAMAAGVDRESVV